MYEGDSFFTLTIIERTGLVLLSSILVVTLVLAFLKITTQFKLIVKLAFSVIFLWLFVWLSPQAYYFYYIFLFDTLEFQNVIKLPPTPKDIFSLLSFSDRTNLSNHSKGILGWVMILISLKNSYFSIKNKRLTK